MQHHRREEEKAMAAQSDTDQTFLSKFGRHAVSRTRSSSWQMRSSRSDQPTIASAVSPWSQHARLLRVLTCRRCVLVAVAVHSSLDCSIKMSLRCRASFPSPLFFSHCFLLSDCSLSLLSLHFPSAFSVRPFVSHVSQLPSFIHLLSLQLFQKHPSKVQ